MAEALSRSMLAGSEDASVLYCEPCGNVPADAYCADCTEYFCSSCANVHQKQRVTKDHKLLRGRAMPLIQQASSKPVSNQVRFKKCPQHPHEELKFFCETHQDICCVACNLVMHKQCQVVYIPDVAKNYKTGPEYTQLIEDLTKMKQLAANNVTAIKTKMKEVETLEKEDITTLEKYRAEIKERIDRQIDELLSQVKQLRGKDPASLNDQHSKSENIQTDVLSAMTKLKASEDSPVELFTESKQSRDLVVQLQTDLNDVKKKSVYQFFTVHKNADVEAVLKNKSGLAEIKMLMSPGCLSRKQDVGVVTQDEEEIVIHDIAVLSTTRVLVTDWTYKTLRLVDSQNGGVVAKLRLTTKPFKLCLVGDGRAVVTLPFEKRIQFIRIDRDTLTLDRSVDMNGTVAGIAACDSHLVVSYQDPGNVEKITIMGKVTRKLNYQTAGKELFWSPYFIAISESGYVFISDCETNTITQLDENLQVIQTFTVNSPMMKTPAGIVFVNSTQLLVAARDSHNIFVFDTITGTVTTLLGQAEGIHNPRAVAWYPVNKALYVSLDGPVKTIMKFQG